MQVNILDIPKFIVYHEALPVTNPVMFEMGTVPTSDGLFSTEIFGEIGSRDRSTRYGWIDLQTKVFTPVIYKTLKRIDRQTDDILSGSMFVSLDEKGYIVEDEQKGQTGIQFYYDNWEQLSFVNTGSATRKTRTNVLENTPKDLVFIDKFLVIPAYLRDFNVRGSGGRSNEYDELNDDYARLLRLGSGLRDTNFGFLQNNTVFQMQKTIEKIYDEFIDNQLAGKTGMFRRNLLGKSIDYATRSVITAPKMYADSWKDLEVPFGYTGIPMSQVVVLFYPYFSKYITDFVELNIDKFRNPAPNVEILNVEEQFSDREINKMLDNFIRDINGRFDPITVVDRKTKEEYPVPLYSENLGRNFTVTDLLFIACTDITADKHVYVTRYPVTSFASIYPSKISILSTSKTMEVTLDDRILKNYPVIYEDYPMQESYWVDSTRINNSYANSLGADFDGDTVSIRGVFTQEANIEADKLIKSKTMILDQRGQNARKIGNDGILSLFSLTSD